VIGLIQRVTHASVTVDGEPVGAIERGLLVLVGVQPDDDENRADRLLARLLSYRIFPDAEGRMNRSVTDIEGGLLLVPQFTLAADTRKGTRPGFSTAAAPEVAHRLFHYLHQQASLKHHMVARGEFGADMDVSLCNQGPVTFWLEA